MYIFVIMIKENYKCLKIKVLLDSLVLVIEFTLYF